MGTVLRRPVVQPAVVGRGVDPAWLAKGLVFASTVADPVNAVTGRRATLNGDTYVRARRPGRVRYFDSAGTVDSFLSETVQLGSSKTYAFRFQYTGALPNTFPRIYDLYESTTQGGLLFYDGTVFSMRETCNNGASNSQWNITPPSTNVPHTMCITINGSDGFNLPSVWLDGVPVTVTPSYNNSGALDAVARKVQIGNRADFLRAWDGWISDFLLFNRELRPGEAQYLCNNLSTVWSRQSRPIYFGVAGGSIYSAAYDESATATDGYTNTVAFAAATSESATATDAFINTAIFAAAVSEQATATDENTNTAVFSATISESGTATEGSDGATAGATYAEISEQADASDSYGATMVAAASISEEATATDGVTGANTTSAAISEEATATDSLAGANTTSAEISEQATATDSTSNTLEAAASISESATASDEQTNTAVINAAVSESATATDFFFGSVPGAGAGDGVSGNHDIVKMGRMMGRS